jgi:glycine cleavage system H protein
MTFDIPDGYRYTESHEWIAETGSPRRVGITDFAQDELGDVVFVELPAEETAVEAGEEFGVIESIKAVSDLYAPVSGVVAGVNDALRDQPELVNSDPYGDGWMLEVEPDGDSGTDGLLTPSGYRNQIE